MAGNDFRNGRTSLEDFVRQHGDLVCDPLWYAQPVKGGKRAGDMVRGSHVIDQPCCRIQY